jgi:hypothetical protein
MKFTAAELTEIRQAFRQRIANAPAKKRTTQRKARVRPTLAISESNYADRDVLTPRLVAAAFSVHPKTVARWADAGTLPSFRTLGGHLRFRWADIRRTIVDDQLDEA